MGACDFQNVGHGETAQKAFDKLVASSRYSSGHEYSGEIGMKDEFVMISLPEGREPEEYAGSLLDSDDERVADKWGPAGCIALGDGKWLFFGWASS
jgi:hypothetical protein